jgi:2-polyprenyl-6-methoxyphenol hydroxylase-like FAD-dependent oxidoreductase
MPKTYDIVTVGGGLGGAALAMAMARNGARVIVLERTTEFKDRVRGEGMSPWGAAEAKELGIFDLLCSVGTEVQWWDFFFGEQLAFHRDLVATTPQHCPMLTFYHPRMQEALLQAAADAGAEVRRGTTVRSVTPASPARVVFEDDSGTTEVDCRIAVGADGRGSPTRRWGGFQVQQEPDFLFVSGVLVDGMPADEHTLRMNMNLATGVMSFLNPQGGKRVRAYLVWRKDAGLRFQGENDAARFFEESLHTGLPQELVEGATAAGPLATFSGADSWVDHPYTNGVALIGDAAASSDPSWGQGLSLTLRDARVLRDGLLGDDDWDRAGHIYAQEHDRYYGVSRTVNDWLSELFYTPGPEGDARRARALPLLAQDASRLPDADFSGPDMELDDATRRRMFGEE